jgi:uncharacterized protein YdaU (DUF1376 family)
MSHLPFLRFYPSDWLFSPEIQGLTAAGRGATINLWSWLWHRKRLSTDDAHLALYAACSPAEWELNREAVLQLFHIEGNELWHEGIDKLRQEANAFHEERSEAGKRGAEARWNGSRNGSANGKAEGRRQKEIISGAQEHRKNPELLPKNFAPTEDHRTIAEDLGVDLTVETKKFRLYWTGKKKADWDRTFRNWLLNAKPSAKTQKAEPKPRYLTEDEIDGRLQ